MKERVVMVAMHPKDKVRDALCERTCELAQYLDDIESAELKSRETTRTGLVRCVHHWRARPVVPSFLAPHVDRGLLEWIGRTEWQIDEDQSRWVVEPRFMNRPSLCEALMGFAPAMGGRATRVDLEYDIVGIQGSSGFRAITNAILAIHFRKLVEAAAKLIENR